jgi:hypothetical protein
MPALNSGFTARYGVCGNLAKHSPIKAPDVHNRREIGAEAFAWRGRSMEACRRTWLFWLATGLFMPSALARVAVAQETSRRVIEARIENREVVAPEEAIRITEGDVIELVWTSDEATELHLHGYDLEVHVRPNEPATMVIEAYATGRFPITSHGWDEGGNGHDALTYLEVYPR